MDAMEWALLADSCCLKKFWQDCKRFLLENLAVSMLAVILRTDPLSACAHTSVMDHCDGVSSL